MAKVLIVGCGYVGTALAEKLLAQNHEVWGLRRNTESLPDTVHPIACSLEQLADFELPTEFDYVFYMPAAGEHTAERYHAVYTQGAKNCLSALQQFPKTPKRLFYISSTSVYDIADGSWVDESIVAKTERETTQALLDGEHAFIHSDVPTTVVRFAGIYGPGRDYMIRKARAGEIARTKDAIYTNRIHQQDCAGMLAHLMQLDRPEALYIGVDCEPVSKNNLLQWLIESHQFPQPNEQNVVNIDEQRMRGNKRCSNEKILATGYRFQYPSFKEGYTELLNVDVSGV